MMYPMSISLSSFWRPFCQKRVYLVRRELLRDSCERMNRQQAYIPITPKVLWVKSALSLPSVCCMASRIRFLPVLLSVSCLEYCCLSAVKVVPLLSTYVYCRLAYISLSLSSSNHPSSLDALPFAYWGFPFFFFRSFLSSGNLHLNQYNYLISDEIIRL